MADNKTGIIVIGFILVLAIFLGSFNKRGLPEQNWQDKYADDAQKAGIDVRFSQHDEVFDSSIEIQEVAFQISEDSYNSRDAVANTMEWVYNHIYYSDSITIKECFDETSSSVYVDGIGDCVSMSKLAVAILREMGIYSRTATGCISDQFSCNVLFAVTPSRQPRINPVDVDNPKIQGGLHMWVEVWLPENGWVIGESTAGTIYTRDCTSYDYFAYPMSEDTGMCMIDDINYIRQCARY